MENLKMDRSSAANLFAELKLSFSQLYTMISLKENHICTIENFIEKYLPIRILSQISEVITKKYSDETREEQRRLSKYERAKYKHYNQILLNDSGIPNIMKLISEVKTRMDGFISKKNKIESGKTIQMARRGGAVDASSIVEEGNSSKDNEDEEEKQKNDSITIKEDFN
jgi:hypothetical protein